MPNTIATTNRSLMTHPFSDPDYTVTSAPRAKVHWRGMKTLWLNTGTLCNIACVNCYIKSSPTNDDLVYLKLSDVEPFLNELDAPIEIGITGGEPFMAPEILDIMQACLGAGHSLLVLTNAMHPMLRPRIKEGLEALHNAFPEQLTLRVSLYHHSADLHDAERGKGSFAKACEGLKWLGVMGITTHIAGRQNACDNEASARQAYGELVQSLGLNRLDPADPKALVLFPEMVERDNPPEISTACWQILGRDPDDIMCASQRMIIRRKGADRAIVTACTLLPHDTRFDMGERLAEAIANPVSLNHPWCASFCVLGGASCSA